MVAAGNRLYGKPYIWGGGHGPSLDTIQPGYDCSSAVSYVLHAGGALGPNALVSGELANWGLPGPGRYVTVYANSGHAFMYVAGLRFDTSYNGTDTGPERRPGRSALARLPHRPGLGRLVASATPQASDNAASHAHHGQRPRSPHCDRRASADAGSADPYSHASTTTTLAARGARRRPGPATAQNTGETPAPPPPTAASQAPSAPAATPEQAIRQFALLYVNWTWRTLPTHLRQLAALSVGAARLAEQQAAAAASRDSEIAHHPRLQPRADRIDRPEPHPTRASG